MLSQPCPLLYKVIENLGKQTCILLLVSD